MKKLCMEITQVAIALVGLCFLWLWLTKDTIRASSLPPGPKGLPFIGNALSVPTSMPWKVFRDWSAIYGMITKCNRTDECNHDFFGTGDVMLLKIPTRNILVLSSVQAAVDLLEKRSEIYSSRPHIRMHNLYVQN